MADEKKAEAKAAPTVEAPPKVSGKTIEAYRDELGTDAATFAGVKARERWAAMQHTTKRQYETAVARFLTGPTVLKGGE